VQVVAERVDPATLSGAAALELHTELVRARRADQAYEALVAARVVETFAFRATGIVDAADWLARASGSSWHEAQTTLRTVSRIESCPDTAQALTRGEISLAQAEEVTLTATQVEGSEARMLADAKRGIALKKLQENGRELRLRRLEPDALDQLRRRKRAFRHWTDKDGMTRVSGALQPEFGVPIMTRVDLEADRLYRAAQRDGDNNATQEQRLADAFVTVCGTGGKPHATKRDVVIVAGVNAIRSGQVTEGEPCHLLSPDGPIPVSPELVRSYLDENDCFVKLVLHNGVHITHLSHQGRKQSAELLTALALGDPPLFHGPECGCGCAKRKGIQLDHLDPVVAGGETSLFNVDPKCRPTHKAKSEAERAAGLYSNRAPPEHGLA